MRTLSRARAPRAAPGARDFLVTVQASSKRRAHSVDNL